MKVKVAGKHMEVGESLAQHIQQCLTNLDERFEGQVQDVDVALSKKNIEFYAEIQANIGHHFVVNCHGADADAYKAANIALDRLETKIKKYRNRIRSLKRGHEKEFVEAKKYVIETRDEDIADDTPITIADMNYPLKPQTVSDAVMHLELSGDPVVVFKNAASGRVNVVYNRKDGNVGWIDPQSVQP